MAKLVLASKSPRRKELLRLISEDFIICPDDSPENADESLSPNEYVTALSMEKCMNVAEKFDEEAVVIGADTVVVANGKILGKPASEEDAGEMLKILSNNMHSVYTGVAVMCRAKNKLISFFEKTDVYFYELTEDEIRNYIATKEPMDKAGAYGIQERGALFVKKVDGDYNNVVGLPVSRLARILKEEFYLNFN